jgi:hypothetical protein
MPTEFLPEDNSQTQRLPHMEASIEALNVRIARLAIGLGVSLMSEADVAQVLRRQPALPALPERRVAKDAPLASPAGSGVDRRKAHQWEELRGLLVLRYGAETRFVDLLGVVSARQLLVDAEAHMLRDGFRPGADGIDLDRLFAKS